VVRAHKQARKDIHGLYELHREKRETAICGAGFSPARSGEKAWSALCKNLTDKKRAGLRGVTKRWRGAGGWAWAKRFVRGIAHSSVALSLSRAALFIPRAEVGYLLDPQPRKRRPVCRTGSIGSDACGPGAGGGAIEGAPDGFTCKRGRSREVSQFPIVRLTTWPNGPFTELVAAHGPAA
jgi:hypothetical protein